eukprot:jgi/Chrpa1/21794/Chrysochromulina_OHIO_Genome00023886-RA
MLLDELTESVSMPFSMSSLAPATSLAEATDLIARTPSQDFEDGLLFAHQSADRSGLLLPTLDGYADMLDASQQFNAMTTESLSVMLSLSSAMEGSFTGGALAAAPLLAAPLLGRRALDHVEVDMELNDLVGINMLASRPLTTPFQSAGTRHATHIFTGHLQAHVMFMSFALSVGDMPATRGTHSIHLTSSFIMVGSVDSFNETSFRVAMAGFL